MGSNTVFISYNHRNGRWLERLLVHLKPLEQTKEIDQIDVWSDRRLKVGDDWKRAIEDALGKTKTRWLSLHLFQTHESIRS